MTLSDQPFRVWGRKDPALSFQIWELVWEVPITLVSDDPDAPRSVFVAPAICSPQVARSSMKTKAKKWLPSECLGLLPGLLWNKFLFSLGLCHSRGKRSKSNQYLPSLVPRGVP